MASAAYPIEVAWSLPDGSIESHLISPAQRAKACHTRPAQRLASALAHTRRDRSGTKIEAQKVPICDFVRDITRFSWEHFVRDIGIDKHCTLHITLDKNQHMNDLTQKEHETTLETSLQKFDSRMQLTLAALRTKSQTQLDEILDFIRRIDKQLQWLDMMLYYTQPPATGRIRIVWTREHADSQIYRPRLVSWKLVSIKAGKELWRYRMLVKPTKAVRGKGGFATHRAEVVKLVALAADLIKEHNALTSYLSNLSQAWIMKERYLSDKEIETVNEIILLIDRINEKGKLHLDYERIMT